MNFKFFSILFFVFVARMNCCDKGWTRFQNKCFKYLNTKVNYNNAVKLCKMYNATLASIHSREEHVFLEDIAKHYSVASGVHWVWLGGKRMNENKTTILDNLRNSSEIKFSWEDGSPFNYSGWRNNCPDVRPDENCILMSIFQSRPSHWCNYKCDSNQDNVFCQYTISLNETNLRNEALLNKESQSNDLNSTSGEACDIGWTLNENYCYKFFEVNQTWAMANTMCLKNNANLLSISSESEQMFVQNFLFTMSGALEAVWLGAKRKGKLKEFQWTDNSSFHNYQNYAPHEPDFRNEKEYCLAMNNVDEYFGLWLDAPCNVLFSVSCKKKARKTSACSTNAELLLNQAQKAFQMNDFIIQLLQKITNRLDETNKPKKVVKQNNNAVALEIKSEVDSVLHNSSLIKLSLHLSIFISIVLICLVMITAVFIFKRRHLIKKPYLSIFSFKNLNYQDKNLNTNEYEELLYNHNANTIAPNTPNTTRNLSDKV